jgi:TolB protein
MIAYAAGPIGQMKIYVRQRNATRAIELSEGIAGTHRWPQWSPDGTKITFQAVIPGFGQSAIYAVPVLGGIPKKLVDTGWPRGHAWSPDGANIAYASRDTIFVISLNENRIRKLATTYIPHSLNWSPDGSQIAYVSGNDSYIFGIYLLANKAPASIWVVSVENGSTFKVSEGNDLNVSPVWLPDSEHLLFVSDRDGTPDIWQTISRQGISGSAIRLTTGLNAHTLSLSSDGKTLAYSRFDYHSNIWSIPIPQKGSVPTSEAKPLTFGNQTIEGIGVSPDGKLLVFDSNINGNQDIYKMPVDGGEPQQLTSHPADDFLPSWSSDGREIVFYSFRKGNRDIHVMSADGGFLEQMTEDPAQERYPDWSHDNRQIVFQSNKTGVDELYVIQRKQENTDFPAQRRLTFGGGRHPRWSPDGSHIAYTFRKDLLVISPQGGDPKVLVKRTDPASMPNPDFVEWSSDSQIIYFKAFDDKGQSSIWSVPISGGEPRLLVRFNDPSLQSNRIEFTTDGSNFYFTIGNHESDIWLMELIAE